jgi:hypothetical protein
MLYLAI